MDKKNEDKNDGIKFDLNFKVTVDTSSDVPLHEKINITSDFKPTDETKKMFVNQVKKARTAGTEFINTLNRELTEDEKKEKENITKKIDEVLDTMASIPILATNKNNITNVTDMMADVLIKLNVKDSSLLDIKNLSKLFSEGK